MNRKTTGREVNVRQCMVLVKKKWIPLLAVGKNIRY